MARSRSNLIAALAVFLKYCCGQRINSAEKTTIMERKVSSQNDIKYLLFSIGGVCEIICNAP